MAKNGLVAQHWTAAAAPQEETHIRKEWGENDISGLYFDIRDSQSQQSQSQGKHILEHGPQSSFHKKNKKCAKRKRNTHTQKLETFTTVGKRVKI